MDKTAIVAIGVAAFAAGLALTSFLRPPAGAPALPTLPGPAPEGDAPTPPPEGDGPALPADAPKSVAELQNDLAAMSQILKDMIESHGEQRRRIAELEARLGITPGGDAPPGGEPPKRYDPDTGQAYTPETVWVPEGLGETTMQLLRDQALNALAKRAGDAPAVLRDAINAAIERTPEADRPRGAGERFDTWWVHVRDFAAAWGHRDPETLRAFADLLAKHAVPYAVAGYLDWVADGQPDGTMAPEYYDPMQIPPSGTMRAERQVAMRLALQADWRAFVDELPFEVKAQYLSWCSDFLKGE